MSVTQNQVAARLGVSQPTVAFALNEQLRSRLNPETCRLVIETARKMGYVPHLAARRLLRSRSGRREMSFDQVGLIYLSGSDVKLDGGCLAVMRGAEYELSKLHASLTFVRVSQVEDWKKVKRLMQAGGVDAWLVYGGVNDEVLNHLNPAKLPYVILGDHRCTKPVHSINMDHVAVGHLAAQHLAAKGHRRIGFIGGTMRFVYQKETLRGFRKGVREMGLDEDKKLIASIDFQGDPNLDGLKMWMRNLADRPTAIFSPESGTTERIFRTLREMNIEVPHKMHFLDTEFAATEPPSPCLSRISLSFESIGRQGALQLRRMVSQPRMTPGEIRIAPALIEGLGTPSFISR